jgi:hypothetical protein
VQVENARAGTTAWRLRQAPGGAIEGYASEVSAVAGEVVHLHVSTDPSARYRVKMFRVGWYGGTGGRLIACLPGCRTDEAGAPQPVPPFDSSSGYLDARWPVSDQFTVGADWTSGYYLLELVLTSGPDIGEGSWIPLIVREPPSQDSDILVQAPVNTWQAYNDWGGRSLYWNHTGVGDDHVSFDRPLDEQTLVTAGGPAQNPSANLPQSWEFPLVRFLERYGYDVSYTTDVDTDRNPAELLRHRLVITAGHDEYWTTTIRDAFDQARDAGTNLAFLGANTGYWQIRYQDDRRTIVEYRDASRDPEPDPALKTVRFRDLVPPRPECELLGVQFGEITIGEANYAPVGALYTPEDPWFVGTGFTVTSMLPGLVGTEYDNLDPACEQPGTVILFECKRPNHIDADAVRYTASSGARVFSSGSLSFSWGLDPGSASADPRLQRFMRNALNDLTRPAPPLLVQAERTPAGVLVQVERHPDARVRAVAIYTDPGGRPFRPTAAGVRLVCITARSSCLDHQAPRRAAVRYAAVALDRWRASVPVASQLLR